MNSIPTANGTEVEGVGADKTEDETSETERDEALSVHAEAEKVLRIVFKVADTEADRLHRYYRAILRDSDGAFHLAGGHVLVGRGGAYFEDTTPDSESPFWIERGCGLRTALCRVNSFIPEHSAPRHQIAYSIRKGERKCRTLWNLMQRRN